MHKKKWKYSNKTQELSEHALIRTTSRITVVCYIQTHIFSKKSNTLNSVGTISLGVSNPINISRPTKLMIDMKMEKSLISFLSYTSANTRHGEDKSRCVVVWQWGSKRKKGRTRGNVDRKKKNESLYWWIHTRSNHWLEKKCIYVVT